MPKTKWKHRLIYLIAFVLSFALLLTACGEKADENTDDIPAYSPTGDDLQVHTVYYQDGNKNSNSIIFYSDASILFNSTYHGTYEFTGTSTLNVYIPDMTSETLLFEIVDNQEIYDSTSDLTYLASSETVNDTPDDTSAGILIGESTEDEYMYYLDGNKRANSIEISYAWFTFYTRSEDSAGIYSTYYNIEGNQIVADLKLNDAEEASTYTFTIIDMYTIQGPDGELYINIGFNPEYDGTTIQGTFDYSVWYGTYVAADGSTIEFVEDTFFSDPAIQYQMRSEKGEGAYQTGTLLIIPGLNISTDGLTITDDYNEFVLDGDTMYVTAVGSSTNGDDFADTYYRE
ncbi:MAG: hypothetical protein LBM60_04935 [Clostridium sp.]|jgi:hypothetical protein|nr:hypothetical protein [Clostridium sp.]